MIRYEITKDTYEFRNTKKHEAWRESEIIEACDRRTSNNFDIIHTFDSKEDAVRFFDEIEVAPHDDGMFVSGEIYQLCEAHYFDAEDGESEEDLFDRFDYLDILATKCGSVNCGTEINVTYLSAIDKYILDFRGNSVTIDNSVDNLSYIYGDEDTIEEAIRMMRSDTEEDVSSVDDYDEAENVSEIVEEIAAKAEKVLRQIYEARA